MSKIKYIILGIISSFTNSLPISYKAHVIIYDNIFNTKIFSDQNLISFLNLSLIIAILIINYKELLNFSSNLIKKNKPKKKHHFFKLLTISSFISIFTFPFAKKYTSNIKVIAIFYIFTSIIIFFSNNKKGHRTISELNIKDSLIIGLSNIITIIPTISSLCSNLFICSKRKIDKKLSFIYSTLCCIPLLFINSLKGIIFLLNNQTSIIDYSISLTISTFLSFYFLNYLKNLYHTNKMYKLSIYCFILAIFLLIWFR